MVIIPSRQGTKSTEATAADAPQGIRVRLASIALFPFLRLRRFYRLSALPILLSEIRNLAYRIQWSLDIREVERLRGSDKARQWRSDGLNLCSQTRTREDMYYTQQIIERFPFLSVLDAGLIQDAWNAGWVSRDREDKSRSQANIDSSPTSCGKDAQK